MANNDEMRLARLDLGPGWIDLSYGEPIILQELFEKYTNFTYDLLSVKELLRSKYQPPKGNNELVAFLEKKYGAKVVVTNGAKQGIAATMYALKKLGHRSCMIHSPYWVSTPTIIKSVGLAVEILNEGPQNSGAFMVTSPNNPDGKELSKEQLLQLAADAKESGAALIHDAAYYTPIYVKKPEDIINVGDAQIYSFSKTYGLSGLRIGYVVVHDEALLPGITEFVELSCSGVSTASQQIALDIESYFVQYPERLSRFESECRSAIAACRSELGNVDPSILTLEPCNSNSMFAWCKADPNLDYKKVKINALDGAIFGKPGMLRLNIAINLSIMKEVVKRLNSLKV